MWYRIRWQYSQWKLLYYPLSPAIHWLLRGLLEEWLFNYLTEYAETRVGWLREMIYWIQAHPTLSVSILVLAIALLIGLWAIRDARKRTQELYGVEDILEKRFTLLLDHADARAKEIKVDKNFVETMRKIAEEILFVQTDKYEGKDFKSKRVQQSIGKDIMREVKSDSESEKYYDLIASALDNDGYGLSGIKDDRQYVKLMDKLKTQRRVPSERINKVINKCMEHSYSLASAYIFHAICLNNKLPVGANVLAGYQSFNRKQRDGSGGMSNCLAELRTEIDIFMQGGKGSGKPTKL